MTNRLRGLASFFGSVLLSSILTAAAIIGAYLFVQSRLPLASPPMSVVANSTPAQSTATPGPEDALSYADALNTYKSVATSAIEASERALDTLKWLVGAVLALTASASALAAYLYRATRDARDKAQNAESAAKDAQAAANKTELHLTTLSSQYARLAERYFEISHQYLELRGRTSSLDSALQAWERGEISRDKIIDAQQWHSWYKWTQEKNKTGWLELFEVARFGEGLAPLVHAAVEMELERVRHELSAMASPSTEDQEYEQRLNDLIHPPSE